MLAIEHLSEDCYTIDIEDAINSIKGAEILVSPLLSYKPILTPPKSTIGNLPPYISYNSKVKETVYFTNKVLIANTKLSNTIKRYYIILKTNSNTQSIYSIN
jgi:hypothetical protein